MIDHVAFEDNQVVVIDDVDAFLMLLEDMLLDVGIKPVLFKSYDAAKEFLKHSTPALIILDMIVHGERGRDFIIYTRKNHDRSIKFVLSTSFDYSLSRSLENDHEVRERFEIARKPFTQTDFIRCIEKAFDLPEDYIMSRCK